MFRLLKALLFEAYAQHHWKSFLVLLSLLPLTLIAWSSQSEKAPNPKGINYINMNDLR